MENNESRALVILPKVLEQSYLNSARSSPWDTPVTLSSEFALLSYASGSHLCSGNNATTYLMACSKDDIQ